MLKRQSVFKEYMEKSLQEEVEFFQVLLALPQCKNFGIHGSHKTKETKQFTTNKC